MQIQVLTYKRGSQPHRDIKVLRLLNQLQLEHTILGSITRVAELVRQFGVPQYKVRYVELLLQRRNIPYKKVI